MKCTAKKAGIDYAHQVAIVLRTIADGGGVATTSDIMGAFNARMAPHTLSAIGKAGVRSLVNRDLVKRGLVAQAQDVDGHVAWALTEKARERSRHISAQDEQREAAVVKRERVGALPPRRVVVVVKKKDDPLTARIAVIAHAEARKRGRRVRLPSYCDEDDAAQEAALRAVAKVHHFDPSRGNVHQFANAVAHSSVLDMVRAAAAADQGRSVVVSGAAYDALADGIRDEEEVTSARLDASLPAVCLGEGLDERRAVVKIMRAVTPSYRAALSRWLAEGADGGQERFSAESRLKDALCAARVAARRIGLQQEAYA